MDHSVTRNINRDLAMRLRSENLEQFTTLVKMHLSFELDLHHTEEYVTEFHLNIVLSGRTIAHISDRLIFSQERGKLSREGPL